MPTIETDRQRTAAVATGTLLVFAACLVLLSWRLYEQLREMNDHLSAIETQATNARAASMAELESEVDER